MRSERLTQILSTPICAADIDSGQGPTDADWQDGYRRQVEFYQWLLRGRGLKVSDRAWFVYANGLKGDAAFDDVLHFRTKVISYDGDASWVEPTLRDVADCLASEHAPGPSPDCAFCDYVSKASAAG